MTGNVPAPSPKRAVGWCDTAGRADCSHLRAAHRSGARRRVGKDGPPPLRGIERAREKFSRQAEWYRGLIRLCFWQGRFFIIRISFHTNPSLNS